MSKFVTVTSATFSQVLVSANWYWTISAEPDIQSRPGGGLIKSLITCVCKAAALDLIYEGQKHKTDTTCE